MQSFREVIPKYARLLVGIVVSMSKHVLPVAVIGVVETEAAEGIVSTLQKRRQLSNAEISKDEWGNFLLQQSINASE